MLGRNRCRRSSSRPILSGRAVRQCCSVPSPSAFRWSSWHVGFGLSLPFQRCRPAPVSHCLSQGRLRLRRAFASEVLLSKGEVYIGGVEVSKIGRRAHCTAPVFNSPPLVILALRVCFQVVFTLKPLGAFDAEMPSQTRQILGILGRFVLCEMARRLNISADLVIVSAGISIRRRKSSAWNNIPGATLGLVSPEGAHLAITIDLICSTDKKKVISPISGVILRRSGEPKGAEIKISAVVDAIETPKR